MKFIKKVSPNKDPIKSGGLMRREDGKKVAVEKTVAMPCVPTGQD